MDCKILLCVFCLFLATPSVFGGKVEEKLTKQITREFTVSPDDMLVISNQYGNINITIGEANRVLVDIVITVSSTTQKQASDIIEKISVDFIQADSLLNVTTRFDPGSRSLTTLKKNSTGIDIDYQISVPSDIFLDLKNSNGNIFVASTSRELSVDLSQGTLELGDVNANLSLALTQAKGRISQIYNGIIKLSHAILEMEDGSYLTMYLNYSAVTTGTLDQLKLISSFSKLNAVSIGSLDYQGRHDTLHIEYANIANAKASSSTIMLDELGEKSSFEMKHGRLDLNRIQYNFSAVEVNASFTNVGMGFAPGTSFLLDTKTNYSTIRHNGLKVYSNVEKSNKQILHASRGIGGGQVTVNLNYGELSIL